MLASAGYFLLNACEIQMLCPVLRYRCFDGKLVSLFRRPTCRALILLFTVVLHDNPASFVEMVSDPGYSEA